jgi:NitT/TauT family transport system permease protein
MRFWPPLAAFVLLALTAEALVRGDWVSAQLMPSPSQVLGAMREFQSEMITATIQTAEASLLGYVLAALAGFSLALLFSLAAVLKRAILPFAIFFQTVPVIAVAPLLIIYLGFGLQTVVACAAIVAVFPVLANTLIGLESIDQTDLDLFRIYSASPWRIFIKLRLPRAYVSIYSGLKIAAGLSVIGTVAGEFVTGSGLGALIDTGRTQQRTDLVFAALVLLSVIGLVLIGLLKLFNSLLLRVRPLNISLKD